MLNMVAIGTDVFMFMVFDVPLSSVGPHSKSATPPKALPTSPAVLAASAIDPSLYGASVHHHHYDGLPEDKRKRRRKKDKTIDDLFCNVSEHGELVRFCSWGV